MSQDQSAVDSRFDRDEMSEKAVEYVLDGLHGIGRIQVDRQMTSDHKPTGKLFLTIVHDYGRYPRYFQLRCMLDQRRADLLFKHEVPTIADFLLLDEQPPETP
jgi:hypothetical protein